ncbi:cytochrome P450 [Solibacillus sp. CAU 1738]|uniref:cytochrome P450 n=1 Tax=Solibacillus sp. CAU 1738 TaxID=3140363 RepID=UPI0032605770
MENQMPREEGIDHSISLLKEGYKFIVNRQRKLHANVFETRILGKKAICMIGEEAAKLFYDTDKFQRNGAAPNRVVQTLFGENSVQTLDGAAHRHRKEMLMSVMTKEEVARIVDIVKLKWEQAIDQWSQKDQIVFYNEMKELLCKVAFQWIGNPLHEQDTKKLTEELAAMFETPTIFGISHWIGRSHRNQVEKNMKQLIRDIRDEKIKFQKNSVLHQFAFYKDSDGNLLDEDTIAVEIINLLRPIVAIAVYANFTLLALHQFPKEKEKLKNYPDYPQMFVQEVRRFYPFFPFVMATVKKDFTWNAYEFKEGTMTLLDIYGTNHDPVLWEKPDAFYPERFASWKGSPFSFIPQGGGDYFLGHRCAGEQMTIEIMKVSLDYLVNKMQYDIPEQDLSFDLNDIPSIPKSKIILENVRRVTESIQ